MIDLRNLTIEKAHKHLTKGDFSATDLAKAYLAQIEKKNKDIKAYLEVFDDVLDQAKIADGKLRSGDADQLPILLGIPLAIKDNILIDGRKASSASKILENYTATYDATAISKLKSAGAVFLGRTNMDEFAMGGSTENSGFGPTKNPHDLTRVPGGSSGGSAAAVAMDGALAALGSDTGGSVRQPASFCGVVGLKPTYGRVSRHGLMALGSSLDVIGPIAKTVRDAETLFNVISGLDPLDSTSMEIKNQKSKIKSLKIGVPMDFVDREGLDHQVRKVFEQSITALKSLGHIIQDVKLPNAHYALAAYYILMPAEASSNLARFDGMKFGSLKEGENLLGDYLATRGELFGREVRRRIIIGTYVLSAGYYDAYYGKANQLRSLIKKDFTDAFQNVDVIMTPTAPTGAFKIGEKSEDPVSMYLADIFTVPMNLAGVPAISVPAGSVVAEGQTLPIGVQFIAPEGREDVLFTVGKEISGN
jgi:aspartyl-tRNA(Asn)/glutamyl-tRNA(Gln) amidotransferase subunit A